MRNFLTAVAAMSAFAFPLHAENLLSDALFETRGRATRIPAGWSVPADSSATFAVDETVTKDGSNALRITAPAAKTPRWLLASHPIEGLRPKTPYTISCRVKTKDLAPKALAYVSLNCFAGEKRLSANDSPVKAAGTKDWTRLAFTIPELPSGTSRTRFVCCLYGAGTAWFSEPQVEAGATATAYAPSREDTARIAADARRREAAARFLASHGLTGPGLPRAAILDLGFEPGRNPAFGYVSDPAVFERALASRCRVVRVSGQDLANDALLNREIFDLLVIPTGKAFPAKAAGALVDYLADGGALFTCGGYAFDKPVIRRNGRWISPKDEPCPIPTGTVPLPIPEAARWNRGFGPGGVTELADIRGPAGEPGIRLSTPSLTRWSTGSTRVSLKGQGVISFLARGDAKTKAGWFELQEADGSRWTSRLDLTPDWKAFDLTPAQFAYKTDSSSVGRGIPGDRVNFDAVRNLQVGVAIDILTSDVPHGFSVCAFKAGADPHAELRLCRLPQINTRTGRIRDAIHPKEEQIQTFDCCEALLNVAETRTSAEMAGILPEVSLDGALSGLSARAQLGVNGHGFGPNRCAWRPILTCRAADGSLRGYAGAFVHNFTGTFAGSSWAFFGVYDRDLFPADGELTEKLLPVVFDALLGRLSLGETTPGYSCYRAGETATLRTCVQNAGSTACGGEVVFRLADESGREIMRQAKRVQVAPEAREAVSVDWKVPEGAPDYLEFTAELRASDGRALDREEGAFVVWTPSVLAKGPKVRREGLRLTLDGASRFFGGAQTFWGQHKSVTARSPRRFRDDFRQMRDHGLRWTRCFLPCRTEEEFRDSDAVVQLAQKYGLALYHTPNLGNTVEENILKDEVERMRLICTRYRDVPGFAIDICNEPVMKMDTPAFRKALGAEPKFDGPADDPDVRRTYEAAIRFQCAWAKTLAETARATRPDTLLSIGWSDGWAGGKAIKDPQLASLELDFTDRHYYGAWARFTRNFKDIDLRVLGKPFLVGECGSKNHPTFQKEDPWGMKDDDKTYDTRFRYLYAHAFGCGATALLSWHWRDPMEGQFPCGLVMPSGVPRPTAATVRKILAAFGKLELVDNPPDVVVLMDESARLTSARRKAIDAAWAADDELRWWGANWSKLTASRERDIPPSVRLVIRPEGLARDTLRSEIGRRLRESGAFFTRREEDPETLETFRVPGRGATGWVFWNDGVAPVTVERGGHRLRVRGQRIGYLQIADDGKLQVCEEL